MGTLKTPWARVNFSGGITVGIIALFLVLVVLGLGLMVLAGFMLYWNIIDIVHVGPNFWNIFWIVIAGLIIVGGLRPSRD